MGPVAVIETWAELATHRHSEKDEEAIVRETEECLMKGQLVKHSAVWARIPLEPTPAGLVWDMLIRLPDIDRTKGRIFKKVSVMELFTKWCCQPGSEDLSSH